MSDQTAVDPGPAAPPQDPAAAGAASAPPAGAAFSDLDLPEQIRQAYTARNMAPTGHNHAKVARRFLEWLQDRGQTLGNMTGTAVEEYLNGIENPVTRNVAASAIRVLFDTCLTVGHKYVAQPVNRVRVPSGKKRVQTASPVAVAGAAPTAPGVAPAPVVPSNLPITYGSAAQSVAAAAVTPSVDPGALAQARPLPTRRPTSGVPSLGGRIRVSKRLDGSEGLGLPVGSRVFIGEYTADDLDGEGSVARFIASYIRPKHGPWAGGRPATYIVERLDNVGNPMAGGSLDVAVMPGEDPAPSTPSTPPPQPQVTPMPVQPAAPAAPAAPPSDKFLDYLMEEQRRRDEKAEKTIAELKEQGKGMDATTLMLLTEKLRPQPIDVAAAAKAFREAQGPVKSEAPALPPPAPVTLPPHPAMGFGGFDPFGPPQPARPDATIEALLAQVRDLTTKVTDMAAKTTAPPAQDPITLMTAMATAMKAMQPPPPPPPPPNPIMDQLAGITLQRLSAEPKTKTLAETLSDLRAVQQFMGGGEGSGPSAGEVIVELINNADKLGDFLAKMKMGSMAPPTLPAKPAQPALPAQPAVAAPQQKTPTPPLPDAAKQAIVALWKAPEDAEQDIVANLWNLLTTLMQAPEPWPMVGKRVMEGFIAADSKPEIRAIVTQLMIWCGAKRSMTEAGIEKIVTVLHRHYSLIYAQMKGGEQKVLKDAEGAAPDAPTGDAPEAEEQAEAGAEVEEVGGEDEEQEQDDTEQDDEWAAKPTEGAQA